jgi:hypothetical protein
VLKALVRAGHIAVERHRDVEPEDHHSEYPPRDTAFHAQSAVGC